MQKAKLASLFSVALLSGCVNQPWPVIQSHMAQLQGASAKVAISEFGYPSNEGNVMGEKYYLWNSVSSHYTPGIYTTTGSGLIGNSSFNYDQTTFGPGQVTNLSCAIRVFVDKQDIITHGDAQGSPEACSKIAERLDSSYYYCVSHLC